MAKRKFDNIESSFLETTSRKARRQDPTAKKHSLDSDEEDSADEDNRLNEDDIEGEEDGVARQVGEERMTAFNMHEELEEGHFDKDGHFIWKKEKEIRDNWLDNIDWQQVKTSTTKYNLDPTEKGLADDSDSEPEVDVNFDEIETYKKMLTHMQPNETVNKAIMRLGGNSKKLSSVERLKKKKAGTLNLNDGVYELTELANKVLTEKGNMDVYQETYEYISKKIEDSKNKGKGPLRTEPELDMYADDFDEKEKRKIEADSANSSTAQEDTNTEVKWEFKWALANEKIEGPFTTSQMLKWVNDGYFKSGVWVRRIGETGQFYNSNRIDFDLYI